MYIVFSGKVLHIYTHYFPRVFISHSVLVWRSCSLVAHEAPQTKKTSQPALMKVKGQKQFNKLFCFEGFETALMGGTLGSQIVLGNTNCIFPTIYQRL